jgi:hypothetical protein
MTNVVPTDCLQFDHRHRLEALRLREKEEHDLKKQLGGKKAKEKAELNYRVKNPKMKYRKTTIFQLIHVPRSKQL